jgi:hypothetical protein
MPDDTTLDADTFRPNAPGEGFSVILGAHPYNKLLARRTASEMTGLRFSRAC